MLTTGLLIAFCMLALIVLFQLRKALGVQRGTQLAVMMVVPIGGIWASLQYSVQQEAAPPEDQTSSVPLTSQACFKCHESHYASWEKTYHRTMTREATPEFIKGDYNDAVNLYDGITSRMTRYGDKFFVETVDPAPVRTGQCV